MMILTSDSKRHIETLARHGAAIKAPDGSRIPLNTAFCKKAVDDCIKGGCIAITFDLELSEIGEPMMIAIWRDGHIDTGSAESIRRVLDR